MKAFMNAGPWYAVPAAAVIAVALAMLAGCATDSSSNTRYAEVASNSCRPGTFAALMSAKVDPEQRPGTASLYKDCP